MALTTIQQSRDILARGVARVRAGLGAYGRNLDQPGPEIKVAPFDAQNVSTGAGLIKLGTSIAAARRQRANYGAAQSVLELEREKTRAEIAKLRAMTSYYEGTGRQTGSQRRVLSQAVGNIPAGTPIDEAGVILRNQSAQDLKAHRTETERRVGRVTAAKTGMGQVDEAVNRMVQSAVTRRMARYEQLFQLAQTGDEDALEAIGISPSEWLRVKDYPEDRTKALNNARAGLLQAVTGRAKIEAEAHRAIVPRRRRYQSIIDEGAQGFDGGEPAGAAGGGEDIEALIQALQDSIPQPVPPE